MADIELWEKEKIPGSWRQIVDSAEGLINVTFIDRINHRKVVRAIGDRCAEQFCPQTW